MQRRATLAPTGALVTVRAATRVQALPWFTGVRSIIDDPARAGWFLPFKPNSTYHVPQCDNNYSPPRCTNLYHDVEQVRRLTREGAIRVAHCARPPVLARNDVVPRRRRGSQTATATARAPATAACSLAAR